MHYFCIALNRENSTSPRKELSTHTAEQREPEGSNAGVLTAFMQALLSGENYQKYLDDNVYYVSLNKHNEELRKIMPWAGEHHGVAEYVRMQDVIGGYCDFGEFSVDKVFGVGEDVAAFGWFTYSGKKIGSLIQTPFSIHAKVRNSKIVYFQFFEDTYATASAYRRSGKWNVENGQGASVVGI